MTNTLERAELPVDGRQLLQKSWRWLLLLGIVWIALGAFAVIMPFAATLSLELLLGAIFTAGGVAQILQAFQWRGWRGFVPHALGGAVALMLGVLLLAYPMRGIIMLTLFLSAFFLIDGLVRIVLALQHQAFDAWRWLLLSGVVGVLIAAVIWLGWPDTALWVLGLLVGIELVLSGWSMVMLAVSARCR